MQNINDEGIITIPFTTPANATYIRINWKKTYDDMLMLNLGSTALPYQPYLITKEAWDDSKEGLDWNHSWGTAALHIIPRCLFGIKPTSPGFASFTVNPKLAFLEHAQIEHPTVKGTIRIEVRRTKDEEAEMVLEVPAGTVAEVTFGDTVMEAKEGIHLIKGRLPLE